MRQIAKVKKVIPPQNETRQQTAHYCDDMIDMGWATHANTGKGKYKRSRVSSRYGARGFRVWALRFWGQVDSPGSHFAMVNWLEIVAVAVNIEPGTAYAKTSSRQGQDSCDQARGAEEETVEETRGAEHEELKWQQGGD